MEPLQAALTVVLLFLPFHWLVARELKKLADPSYLRRQGIIVARASALEAHAMPIGTYMGQEIWESVTFMGMRYRFDRVQPPHKRHAIGPRELFLAPGLVYVTD